MPEWMNMANELGPEKIVQVYDPRTGMKGVVVIDCTALGMTAGGGIRMLPDITTREIFQLARAMTYKFGTLGVPIGGAKSGIWADPTVRGEERKNIMRAFGRAVKPLILAGLAFGADIGTEAEDLDFVFEGAELPPQGTGLMAEKKDGEPIENHVTGYGVVVAVAAACEFAGIDRRLQGPHRIEHSIPPGGCPQGGGGSSEVGDPAGRGEGGRSPKRGGSGLH